MLTVMLTGAKYKFFSRNKILSNTSEVMETTLINAVTIFLFMAASCVNNIKHFIVQLMYTNYKILRLLK